MRILHLLSQTELTGAESYAAQLISLQIRDGHDVFVISDKIHIKMFARFISMPISTSRFWQRMRNILALRQFLKTENIQIIHCHSRGAVRHAYWSRIGTPVGLTTSLHGEQHFSFSKKFFHLYGEVLIAVCENIKTSMVNRFKTSESIIRVIRNPVSVLKSASSPNRKSPHLALAGRSSGPKGLNFEKLGFSFFKAWLDQVPDLKISIVAPNADRFSKTFQMHLAKLGAEYPGQILIEDQVKDLTSHLQNFDLVVSSGRIAVETLLCKTKLLAMGEFCHHGLIDHKNYQDALSTNFGDIGDGTNKNSVDYSQVSNEVLKFFKDLRDTQGDAEVLQQKASQDFSTEMIHQKVLEVYKGVIFKRQHPSWIPILMYHKVPDQEIQTRHRIFVVKENFEKHLQFFKRRKFSTMTFGDLLAFWDLKKPMTEFPKKPLLLTFDDGYVDNLTNVQPMLKKMQMRATIFLLADHSITENTWDADTGETPSKLMTLSEKKQLDPNVFEVGSHGFHHIHLTENKDLALNEMRSSQIQLEKDFQQKPLSFAYPYGSSDLELAEECFAAGYRFAVNTDQGGLHLGDHPQFLFRVNVFPEDSSWSLRKKTSTWYRKYFYHKRRR